MPIATENKAKLSILDADGRPIGDPIPVQFNPEQYSKSWTLDWQEVGNSLQWSRTTPGDFVLKLKFDTYEGQDDVTNVTGRVLTMLDPSTPSQPQPIGCLFQWGKVFYKGVVKSIQEDYTLFLANGTPVRSELTLTLQPWPGELQISQSRLL
jgi:contractile injection system tube protein